MAKFQEKSVEMYKKGYSCSEAVVKAAQESGIISREVDSGMLNSIASVFSGGMGGSGCACGAITGAQMVLGLVMGRKDLNSDSRYIKKLSGKFIEKFKEKRKATCCRVLTSPYKNNPLERRENCTSIVEDAAAILEGILEETIAKV